MANPGFIIDNHGAEFNKELRTNHFSPKIELGTVISFSGGGTTATAYAMGIINCLVDQGWFHSTAIPLDGGEHISSDKCKYGWMHSPTIPCCLAQDAIGGESGRKVSAIAGTSGGTILVEFMELSHAYGYDQEPDWYDKYIRTPLYGFTSAQIGTSMAASVIMNPLNFFRLSTLVTDVIQKAFAGPFAPYWREYLDSDIKNDIIFLYNYLDYENKHLSFDHSDLFRIENGKIIKTPEWYLLRLYRCTFPISITSNRYGMDAGICDNDTSVGIFDNYNFDRIVIGSLAQDGTYVSDQANVTDTTKTMWTYLLLLISTVFGTISYTANNITRHLSRIIWKLLHDKGVKVDPVFCIDATNPTEFKNPDDPTYLAPLDSALAAYQDAFDDFTRFSIHYYIGIFYSNEYFLRLAENLGYIMMARQLNFNGELDISKFDLPNAGPEYHDNAKIKQTFSDWMNVSDIKLIIMSILSEIWNRFWGALTAWTR